MSNALWRGERVSELGVYMSLYNTVKYFSGESAAAKALKESKETST